MREKQYKEKSGKTIEENKTPKARVKDELT